jgi:hypothetical protein
MIKLHIGLEKGIGSMTGSEAPTAFLETLLSSSSVRASMNSLLRLGKLACDMNFVLADKDLEVHN